MDRESTDFDLCVSSSNGVSEARNGTQEAQKSTRGGRRETSFCASCVLFLCFLCSSPWNYFLPPGGAAALAAEISPLAASALGPFGCNSRYFSSDGTAAATVSGEPK